MKISILKKMLLLITVFLYPFMEFYSSIISDKLNLSTTEFTIIFFAPSVIGNLKGIIDYILKKIPYYYISIILALIFFIWSEEISRGLYYIISLLMASLFGYSIIKLNLITKVWKVFSFSTTLFAVLLYLGLLQKGFDISYLSKERFAYMKGEEISLDPNWLAVWLSIGVIYYYFAYKKNKTINILTLNINYRLNLICLMILNLYFIFLTASRTAILSLFLSFLFYFLIRRKWLLLYFFSSILVIVLTVQILIFNIDNRLIDKLILFDPNEESRLELIEFSIEALTEDATTFVFGHGTGAGDRAIGKYFSGAHLHDDGILRYNNHNLYLDWILQTGVAGLFYLFGLFLLVMKLIKIAIYKSNYPLIILLLFILIASNFYNPIKNSVWILIGGLLLALVTNKGTVNYFSKINTAKNSS